MITASLVKELREKTGVGMMDCKRALVETDGDLEKAVDYLREKGLSKAAKKADRVTAEGLVASYIHGNGRIGVLVEVNCETDFVARSEDFQQLVKDVAMQIAATNPRCLTREDVPQEAIDHEREVLRQQALHEGQPEAIVDKMTEGRLEKFYRENVLLEQEFVKDTDKSVQQMITEMIAKIGENISVRRFTRYQLGEGIEKRQDDFASEVMATMNQ